MPTESVASVAVLMYSALLSLVAPVQDSLGFCQSFQITCRGIKVGGETFDDQPRLKALPVFHSTDYTFWYKTLLTRLGSTILTNYINRFHSFYPVSSTQLGYPYYIKTLLEISNLGV